MVKKFSDYKGKHKLIVYTCRNSPTKLDKEVLLAIEGVDIDTQMYPSIQKWKSTIKTYSSSDMQR